MGFVPVFLEVSVEVRRERRDTYQALARFAFVAFPQRTTRMYKATAGRMISSYRVSRISTIQ